MTGIYTTNLSLTASPRIVTQALITGQAAISCRRERTHVLEAKLDLANYLISILISLTVGLVGFILAYKIFDWLTPGVNFSDQLNADNRSVAIFLAGLFVGLGLLLGNAIK